MVNYTESDFKRSITHNQYRHGNKKTKNGGLSRLLPKRITDNKHIVKKHYVDNEEEFAFANDTFLQCPVVPKILPEWGGLFLFLFLGSLFLMVRPSQNEIEITAIITTIVFFIGFTFFAIYYYTMPKKECIFNRKDGLVTFPGFMWHKNITMSIDKILFSMSSPSVQGGGAFNLQIVRPDKSYSFYLCTLGKSCYEDLSFFLWYMDKNRPLPPGEGFDPYRQQDFERRKAEGFPKPLFESAFDTPEDTEKQQAERKLIGGW